MRKARFGGIQDVPKAVRPLEVRPGEISAALHAENGGLSARWAQGEVRVRSGAGAVKARNLGSRRPNRFIADWKIIGEGSVETAVFSENPDLNPDLKQKLGQEGLA